MNLNFCVKKIYLILGFIILIEFKNINGVSRNIRTNEICAHYNGYRLYLDMGLSGTLEAHNVTTVSRNQNKTESNSQEECVVELVTCPSCVFKITLRYMNFETKCNNLNNTTKCQCDHLAFIEPPYDSNSNVERFCGSNGVFKSKTRYLQIKLVYSTDIKHAFTLDYVAEQNRDIVVASPGRVDNKLGSHNREISSPFFPQYYNRDLTLEHVLTCNVQSCRIHVRFIDFQLALDSVMEFFDSNGERVEVSSGAQFRPPVIISSGPSMVIRFSANGGTGSGYRAKVTFITPEAANLPILKPITNCGGFVDNIGGAITMMKMMGENSTEPSRIFDCIWIIKPPNSYLHLKTHISLRVENFTDMGPSSSLVVRQGTTSDRPILAEVTASNNENLQKNFVVPLLSGFYVHLSFGEFNAKSTLALVYTVFSYMNCYTKTEFLCKNHRCIPSLLQCDGFDHCGDNSDEPESCLTEWENELINRRWYQNTPNYYFPKMERYPDLKTTTLIFVMSSLSLILMISCMILMIHRNENRARRDRELQNQLQTISELLDGNNNIPRIEEPEEAPPYEAPPNYDEVIKVGMDDQIKQRSRSRSGRKVRMHRRRSSANSNVRLSVALPAEEVYTSEPTSSFPQNDSHLDVNVNENFLLDSNMDYISKCQIFDFCSSEGSLSRDQVWDENSRSQNSWIINNSEDSEGVFTEGNRGPFQTAFNMDHMRELDDYFSSYQNSNENSQSLEMFPSQNQLHSNCATSGVRSNMQICENCIEVLYSPKTCKACKGRISFRDLKFLNSLQSIQHLTLYKENSNQKLCNCFPKYPSQYFSSIQPSEVADIQILPKIVGKCSSYDEMILASTSTTNGLTKASSHTSLPGIIPNNNDDE